ncbi:hypothetical protein [Thauera sp. SDU_THAU2]|uniref:hypothetical protein n=1 Tax=Thauera sp. SDU_THAU2 TaxID=3136633 RepID=UPI00311DECAF
MNRKYFSWSFKDNLDRLCPGQQALTDIGKLETPLPVQVPPDGRELLELMQRHLMGEVEKGKKYTSLVIGDTVIHDSLELWPDEGFGIQLIYCKGSLTIDGDLWNSDISSGPMLVVTGDLKVRNWMRGGMACFIGGDVTASGLIVGEYNDGPLFVGGDLNADNGYIKRIEPYHFLPEFQELHQIAGRINAKTLDLVAINWDEDKIAEVLLPEAIAAYDGVPDDIHTPSGGAALIERSLQGKPIWR